MRVESEQGPFRALWNRFVISVGASLWMSLISKAKMLLFKFVVSAF